jgi:hypothetical protein
MNEAELERYRKYIDDLIVKKNKGDISEEFYEQEFDKYYEAEKKFGLLVPGSPFWDEMLDEYNQKYPPETDVNQGKD